MKKFTIVSIMVCVLLNMVSPVQAANTAGTEFERLLEFIKEHPQGGTFDMQEDMVINADVITRSMITIHTNGFQIRIEENVDGDSNVNFDNFNNDDEWAFVDDEKTLTIEGSGKSRPLVYMDTSVSAFGLSIHCTEGTALEIGGGEGLYAKYDNEKNSIRAYGNGAIGVLNENPYDADYYPADIVNVSIYTDGENSVGVKALWFRIGYSRIEVNGGGSKAIDIPDGYYEGDEVIIIENNRYPEKKWKLAAPMPVKKLTALRTHTLNDLPLPKKVEISAVSNTGETKSFQISLSFDQSAYMCGMQTHKPFYLYGIADQSSSDLIEIDKYAFPFYIIPDTSPDFDMSLYMIRDDTDYYFHIPRAYNSRHINLYTSKDGKQWTFQRDSIDSMSQYEVGCIDLPSHIAVSMLQVKDVFIYAKVEIEGGYYDGRSYIVKIHDAAGNPIPDNTDQEKDDGGGEGNDGQGGGRGESAYVPDEHNDESQEETKTPAGGQDASRIIHSIKKEQKKRALAKHMEKNTELENAAIQDSAITGTAESSKKNTSGKHTVQLPKSMLQSLLLMDDERLKSIISKEQYEVVLNIRDIMGDMWESSAPLRNILQRLFQKTS